MNLFGCGIAARLGALFGLLLSVIGSQPAAAVPILSGQTLKVEFSFAAAPDIGIPQLPADHPFRVADYLAGALNVVRLGGFGQPSATFALYDGSDLLGSYVLAFDGFTTFGFSAPGGVYTFRSGTAGDFAPIADGTIDGILLITNTGPVDLDLNVLLLEVGHATQSNGYIPFSPLAAIESQALLVTIPEPAAMTLMLGPLTAGIARVRRRKARA
jgi:hypothetical protein